MKHVGLIYDFDMTLSEEYQQEPLLRKFSKEIKEKYGIEDIENYFSTLCSGQGIDICVGAMQQILIDSKNLFGGLTNQQMRKEFAPLVKLSTGLPEWFDRIDEYIAELNLDSTHHIVSAGFVPLIEGSPIAPYLSSIHAGNFIEDKDGINLISHIVDPYNKMREITHICKGEGREDSRLAIDEYEINYDHVIVFGDGKSDKSMFNFVRERGGYAIGVYQKYDDSSMRKALELIGNVNFIVPRDYSAGSRLEEVSKVALKQISKRNCTYDYRLVHALKLKQLRHSELINLTSSHLNSCDDCSERSKDTVIYW